MLLTGWWNMQRAGRWNEPTETHSLVERGPVAASLPFLSWYWQAAPLLDQLLDSRSAAWHDRSVGDAQVADTVHLQLRIDDRRNVRAHSALPQSVEIRSRTIADELDKRVSFKAPAWGRLPPRCNSSSSGCLRNCMSTTGRAAGSFDARSAEASLTVPPLFDATRPA